MADLKISELTNLTAADPANDMIPIVDVSATPPASGSTKRISINNILACSPTATLASATITGNLTVDTNTLFVDSANNRVGVGTAAPITPWDVRSNGNPAALFLRTTDPAAAVASAYIQAPVSTGFSSTVPVYGFWYQNSGMGNPAADTLNWIIASGEAMRLNSTGLGVGGSPTRKLSIVGSGATYANINSGDNTSLVGLLLGGTSTPSAGQVIYDNTANSLAFFTSGATQMTLNSTGLGVGASPATRLHISNTGDVYARIATTSVSKAGVQFSANGVVRSHLLYDDGAGTTYLTTGTSFGGSGQALAIQSGTSLSIYTNNQLATAQMTLDASGNLLVGTTTTSGNAGGLKLSNVGGTLGQITFSNNSGVADYVARFNYGSTPTLVGTITVDSGGTTYNTTSDYRLKESVQPLVGGLARVSALKPSIYKWKSDGSSGEGFLAHELAEVVPFAVTGEKDAVNEDGSVKAQGVDLSRVVPILVAAIQELAAEVNALKNA